jgi:hypothetical protein
VASLALPSARAADTPAASFVLATQEPQDPDVQKLLREVERLEREHARLRRQLEELRSQGGEREKRESDDDAEEPKPTDVRRKLRSLKPLEVSEIRELPAVKRWLSTTRNRTAVRALDGEGHDVVTIIDGEGKVLQKARVQDGGAVIVVAPEGEEPRIVVEPRKGSANEGPGNKGDDEPQPSLAPKARKALRAIRVPEVQHVPPAPTEDDESAKDGQRARAYYYLDSDGERQKVEVNVPQFQWRFAPKVRTEVIPKVRTDVSPKVRALRLKTGEDHEQQHEHDDDHDEDHDEEHAPAQPRMRWRSYSSTGSGRAV